MHPDIRIRRLRAAVYTYGVGVILFALWSAAEMTLELMLSNDIAEIVNRSQNIAAARIAAIITIIIIVGTGFIIRYYITSRAVRVAKGQKCSNRFLLVAIFLAIFSLVLTVGPYLQKALLLLTPQNPSIDFFADITINRVVNMVIEISSDVILLELVAAVIMLKKAEARYAA